jgi:O-antigen/teichoic acid export membrane protein
MDDKRILVSATLKGTAWNYLIFGLSKGVTFVSTVILARLLSPDEFGLMALGLIVIGYLDTFRGIDCFQLSEASNQVVINKGYILV